MKVERKGDVTTLTLTRSETQLLRRVLERASFIDTPVDEQPQIATFASTALEQLGDAG
jgi:hypothetical protein